VERIRAAADSGARLFGSEAALGQWLDYRIGELAACACLLGATEQRQHASGEHTPAQQQAASNAATWARRRFSTLAQALVTELGSHRPYSRGDALRALVDGYQDAIGDVEQQLPGADEQADVLLRRDAGHGGATLAASEAAATSTPAAQAVAVPVAPGAVHRIVHDCVLKWLRSEARRDAGHIDLDTAFTTLGMDSLATASIAADLEQELGLAVQPELLFEYQTINQLAGFLDSRLALTPQGAQ
jgi:acyl carrier protein